MRDMVPSMVTLTLVVRSRTNEERRRPSLVPLVHVIHNDNATASPVPQQLRTPRSYHSGYQDTTEDVVVRATKIRIIYA